MLMNRTTPKSLTSTVAAVRVSGKLDASGSLPPEQRTERKGEGRHTPPGAMETRSHAWVADDVRGTE